MTTSLSIQNFGRLFAESSPRAEHGGTTPSGTGHSASPAAENDLLDQADYYDQQSGLALGDRFLTACEEGFARLGAFPESGTALRFRHPRLQSIRFILVPSFENILIFYTFCDGQVRIVRVLHGNRDIDEILEQE